MDTNERFIKSVKENSNNIPGGQKYEQNKLVFTNIVCLNCNSNFKEPNSLWLQIVGSQAYLDSGNLSVVGGELKCTACGEQHVYFLYKGKLILSRISVPTGYKGVMKRIIEPEMESVTLLNKELCTTSKNTTLEENNLLRWMSIDFSNPLSPANWVQNHNYMWDHQDWLQLLNNLEKSEYWPMNPDKIGEHLGKKIKHGAR